MAYVASHPSLVVGQAVLCLRTPVGGGSEAAGDAAGATGDGVAERSCPHAFHTYACACKAVDPAIAKPLTQVGWYHVCRQM